MRIPQDHPIQSYIENNPDMPWHHDAKAILAGLDDRDRYSYSDLMKMCSKEEIDAPLVAASTILSTSREAIFRTRILFVDGDDQILLQSDQAQKVLDGKTISHPLTGQVVNKPQSQTYLIFELKESVGA